MQEQTLKINRITPDQVKAAYESTGLKPEQCIWIDTSAGRNCACGLSTVYVSKFDQETLETKVSTADGYFPVVIGHGLELDYHYVDGFTCGFDGASSLLDRVHERFKQGYEDGVAAWEAVKHLAGAHG